MDKIDIILKVDELICKVLGVDGGHLFDLGTRQLEVLHLPGHSPGSLGKARNNKNTFPGVFCCISLNISRTALTCFERCLG